MSSKRLFQILIAEDEEINYFLLEVLLKNLDTAIEPIRAKHGKEAVEICEKRPDIDLVLMDLKMPIMSGFEATKLIREIRADLPIIAQTAHVTQEAKKEALAAGCNDFFTKPIDQNKLSDLLNSYLSLQDNNHSPSPSV